MHVLLKVYHVELEFSKFMMQSIWSQFNFIGNYNRKCARAFPLFTVRRRGAVGWVDGGSNPISASFFGHHSGAFPHAHTNSFVSHASVYAFGWPSYTFLAHVCVYILFFMNSCQFLLFALKAITIINILSKEMKYAAFLPFPFTYSRPLVSSFPLRSASPITCSSDNPHLHSHNFRHSHT